MDQFYVFDPRRRSNFCALGLLIALLTVPACSGPLGSNGQNALSGPTPTVPDNLEYHVDPDFVGQVLADGVVTLEELEVAHQLKFRCLVEAGVDGKISLDLRLAYDGPSELGHQSEETLDAAIFGCESSIGPIVDLYRRAHDYDTPGIRELRRLAILACLRDQAPNVYSELSSDWDLSTLTIWIREETEEFGPSESVAASDCVNSNGATWISLREAAGMN